MDHHAKDMVACAPLASSLSMHTPFSRRRKRKCPCETCAVAHVCTLYHASVEVCEAASDTTRYDRWFCKSIGAPRRLPGFGCRRGDANVVIRCISPFQDFGDVASHCLRMRTQGVVCFMVPIGTVLRSKICATAATLASVWVASTVDLDCRCIMKVWNSYVRVKDPV